MEEEDYNSLRTILTEVINSERRALRTDAEHIEIDNKIRTIFEDARLPEDLRKLRAELTKVRRIRYLQYLRAFLEEMSYDE